MQDRRTLCFFGTGVDINVACNMILAQLYAYGGCWWCEYYG
jgi:hypothetical protein